MSYDICIFFNDPNSEGIESVVDKARQSLSIPFVKTNLAKKKYGCRLVGLDFSLSERSSYLEDHRDMVFSLYEYELDITSHRNAMSIVHPVAMYIGETLSRIHQTDAMVCLSGVEFFGALFSGGDLVKDEISSHKELYAAYGWERKQ